jgi:hypothetical protein
MIVVLSVRGVISLIAMLSVIVMVYALSSITSTEIKRSLESEKVNLPGVH